MEEAIKKSIEKLATVTCDSTGNHAAALAAMQSSQAVLNLSHALMTLREWQSQDAEYAEFRKAKILTAQQTPT
jgi:hypothetical protein